MHFKKNKIFKVKIISKAKYKYLIVLYTKKIKRVKILN